MFRIVYTSIMILRDNFSWHTEHGIVNVGVLAITKLRRYNRPD